MEEDESFEAGSQAAGFEADFSPEGIRIDAAAFSFDDCHFAQNLVCANGIIKSDGSISAKSKTVLRTEI